MSNIKRIDAGILPRAETGPKGSLAVAIGVRVRPRWTVQRRFFLTHVQRMAFEPKQAGRNGRIDTGIPPPGTFVAAPMDVAMVSAA